MLHDASSFLKLTRAFEDRLLIVINLGGKSCRDFILNNVIYGWWSENAPIKVLDDNFKYISENLHKKFSRSLRGSSGYNDF